MSAFIAKSDARQEFLVDVFGITDADHGHGLFIEIGIDGVTIKCIDNDRVVTAITPELDREELIDRWDKCLAFCGLSHISHDMITRTMVTMQNDDCVRAYVEFIAGRTE